MKLIRYTFYLLLSMVSLGAAALFIILYFFSPELPDHTSLKKYSPALSSRVFLKDGTKLCEYVSEKRYFVPISKVPVRLIKAFLSVEDKHFLTHTGIDFYGIARSMLKNLENLGKGKRPQGASTITQQVARIFLIKNNEISYIRKIKEAILSYRIENSLSKTQILELYLNQIYLGMGSYGVAAAAKVYFGKSIDELTIAECSYLASLAKGANNYHPVKHKSKAIARRNWAITRQLEDGYITKKEAEQALNEKLTIPDQEPHDETVEYFSEEIRKYLIEKFPFESLNKEGLIVRSTLDINLQRCAYDALCKGIEEVDRRFGWRGAIAKIDVRKPPQEIMEELKNITVKKSTNKFSKAVIVSHENKFTIMTENNEIGELLESDIKWAKKLKLGDVIFTSKINKGKNKGKFLIKQFPEVQGAIVVVDVNNGKILAMQGGYSFALSKFNRVTQATRQVGSAFKPFVYLAGLENGFAPNSIIDASPVEIDLGGKLGTWRPRNYQDKVLDKVTFRQAIERSINTATIRIAQEVEIDKIAKIAEQFEIFESMPRLYSYALGAGETTLLKLTTAYAMLANGGKRIIPTMVEYIQDKHGKVIYKMNNHLIVNKANYDTEFPPKLNDNRQQILGEQSIYQLTSLLEGVMQRGSGASANFLNFTIAGKTGTSNDSKDTWFIGYTPDIAIGVFVGFDDYSKSLGKDANGTNTALPIFINFMVEAKKYLTPKPFKIPQGIKLKKVNKETGAISSESNIDTIIEAFKEDEEKEKNLIEERNNTAKLIEDENPQGNKKQVTGIY